MAVESSCSGVFAISANRSALLATLIEASLSVLLRSCDSGTNCLPDLAIEISGKSVGLNIVELLDKKANITTAIKFNQSDELTNRAPLLISSSRYKFGAVARLQAKSAYHGVHL